MTRVFLDSSVLVAASEVSHPHHRQALAVLVRVSKGLDKGFISVHSIAETYAALTRLPVSPHIHAAEAERIVRDNVLRHCSLTQASEAEYLQALTWVQEGGWSGARIYDALHLACAAQCGADRIYTFNTADFQRLAPPRLQPLICSP